VLKVDLFKDGVILTLLWMKDLVTRPLLQTNNINRLTRISGNYGNNKGKVRVWK